MTDADGSADHIYTLVELGEGATASLAMSRITHNMVRQITVTTGVAVIAVDYVDQSAGVYWQDRIIANEGRTAQFCEYAFDVAMDRVQVRRIELLQPVLAQFPEIICHDGEPMVSGDDALTALRLVWQNGDHLAKYSGRHVAAE